MSHYQVIAESCEDLHKHMNDHDKFISIRLHDLSWFNDLGFIECTMYPQDKEYSRNYYKIDGDEVLLINLRTQNVLKGQFDIRKKSRLVHTSHVISFLNSPNTFEKAPYGMRGTKDIVLSADMDFPSITSYLSMRIEDLYFDSFRNHKQVTKFINTEKIEFTQSSNSDFYLSFVEFINKELTKIVLTSNGVQRSGAVLSEFVEHMPTVNDFFYYDKQFTEDIQCIYSALVI